MILEMMLNLPAQLNLKLVHLFSNKFANVLFVDILTLKKFTLNNQFKIMITYIVVSYLISIGMTIDWEYNNEDSPIARSYFFFFVFAPITIPMYIGYKISKIK